MQYSLLLIAWTSKFLKNILKSSTRKKNKFHSFISTLDKSEIKQKEEIFSKKQFDKLDNILSIIDSPHWLSNPEIAKIIKDSLLFRQNVEYDLFCFCIMPNHVHILMKPLKDKKNDYYSLKRIMHNHKSYTANHSNKILNRDGKFWYPEYYDHYVRNEEEFLNIINYIVQNPVKAKLVNDFNDWKYNWVNDEVISL